MDASKQKEAQRSVHELASLVEFVSRTVQGICWTAEMQAAQWSALRFFAHAEKQHCTVVGLAAHQGTNPGTSSRTVASLVKRGLIETIADQRDRRIKRVTVTAEGKLMLKRDPLKIVENGLRDIDHDLRLRLLEDLAVASEALRITRDAIETQSSPERVKAGLKRILAQGKKLSGG